MRKLKYLLSIIALFWVHASLALAWTTLSISAGDITFSKADPLAGESIRIFARAVNSGDHDLKGFVIFSNNGKQISEPQAVSLKPKTYDDVFIDWKFEAGVNKIEVKPVDDNMKAVLMEDGSASVQKEYFVDLDTDGDTLGDSKDSDDDNDGVSDDNELASGTNPLSADTDNDDFNDKIDSAPLDPDEYRDTDRDGVGDNEDKDDDNDNLTDYDELYVYGTNPLSADTDSDGFDDKKEAEIKTDPKDEDTDHDKIIDSKDADPLDGSIATASLMNTVNVLLQEKPYIYVILGAITVIICFLIFRRKRD